MASVCMSQNLNHIQQFQLLGAGSAAMLLQHHQTQQQLQQFPHQSSTTIKHKAIAPALNTGTKTTTTTVLGVSNSFNIQSGIGPMQQQKKKYTYANMPYGEQLPSVARRNARERNRVKQVNNGFATLRKHIPQTIVNTLTNGGRGASKKLSKVDTLRMAVEYIRGLQDLLDDNDDSCNDDSYGSQGTGSPTPSNYYAAASPDSQYHHIQNAFNSEASASPSPSYSDSDISIGGANYLQPPSVEEQQHHQIQFKFEPFDSYDCNAAADADTPDDEELLDYISSWQQQ